LVLARREPWRAAPAMQSTLAVLLFSVQLVTQLGDEDPLARSPREPLPPASSASDAVSPATAEGQPAPAETPKPPLLAATGKYRIGPDDTLKLQVVGHPEFAATGTVTAKGTIVLPILDEVAVQGLTLDEVHEKLTQSIANGFVRDPRVLVEVVEYNNMKVWVFGFVAEPGERRLTGPMTLLELLKLVGDVKANAGSIVTITRTRSAAGNDGESVPETDTVSVDLDALLRQGDLSQNVELQNGDKIYVPSSSPKVAIFGEVTKPGHYPYRDGMTLSDLIQGAGGLTEYANEKKIKIKRVSLPKPINANLRAFYKDGQSEANVVLSEGDTVIVNSSFLF
jgi:polysaccharide export outer membrane protein